MPAIAERLPAKYLVKAEAPKIIASRGQHEAYIQRLLELQRKAHRSAEETETAKLLVVLIADYEAKRFTIEKASGVEVLRGLLDGVASSYRIHPRNRTSLTMSALSNTTMSPFGPQTVIGGFPWNAIRSVV